MGRKHPFTMRTKLIFMFLGLIVLPLGFFGTMLFAIQRNITESYVAESLERSTSQLAERLNQELQAVCGLGNLYYLDGELVEALSEGGETGLRPETVREITSRYSAYPGRIHADASVLTPEGKLYGGQSYTGILDPLAVARTAEAGGSNTVWRSSFDFPEGAVSGDYLYAVRALHNHGTWEPTGTLLLSMRETELRKIYSGYLTESQNAYLLDRRGNVISFVNNQGIPYQPDAARCALYYGFFPDEAEGRPQYVTYHTITSGAWTLVVASDPVVLLQPYKTATNAFLAALLLCFAVAVVLSFIFSARFVRPVRQLCDNIALVKEGNFDTMVPVTSSDEIGQLSEQYNEMLLRLKELLAGMVEEQESRHRAEMQALQAQINPHFIYNALASVRFLVFSGKNDEADRALLSLINILRGTLSNPHILSTVGQEIKLLQDYVSLQRISFSKPLDVEFDVDESVRDCRICKLTLQPIVENAFIHGFEGNLEHCRLTVRVRDLGDRAEITVEDNGTGFDTHSARPTNWGGVESPHNGLGVENVRQRLTLTFGQSCGLEIKSRPGCGTVARITIPKTGEKGSILVYDNPGR